MGTGWLSGTDYGIWSLSLLGLCSDLAQATSDQTSFPSDVGLVTFVKWVGALSPFLSGQVSMLQNHYHNWHHCLQSKLFDPHWIFFGPVFNLFSIVKNQVKKTQTWSKMRTELDQASSSFAGSRGVILTLRGGVFQIYIRTGSPSPFSNHFIWLVFWLIALFFFFPWAIWNYFHTNGTSKRKTCHLYCTILSTKYYGRERRNAFRSPAAVLHASGIHILTSIINWVTLNFSNSR